MLTIAETDEFKSQASKIWSTDERLAFFSYIAAHPLDGDVIPSGGGLRKIRWTRSGTGKRGGVRVIYYNMLEDGLMLMLAIYTKSTKENVSSSEMKRMKGMTHE